MSTGVPRIYCGADKETRVGTSTVANATQCNEVICPVCQSLVAGEGRGVGQSWLHIKIFATVLRGLGDGVHDRLRSCA